MLLKVLSGKHSTDSKGLFVLKRVLYTAQESIFQKKMYITSIIIIIISSCFCNPISSGRASRSHVRAGIVIWRATSFPGLFALGTRLKGERVRKQRNAPTPPSFVLSAETGVGGGVKNQVRELSARL